MDALKLSKNGFVAKVILWDTRDVYKPAEYARLAKQGVCQVFWEFIFQGIFCGLFKAFSIILTMILVLVNTIFVLPFRFLFMGQRLDYSWFKSWRGKMFVPISWMPKNKSDETIGPLAVSSILKIYALVFVIYCVVATIATVGSLVGTWKIDGGVGTAAVFPGTLVAAIVTFALINNYLHDFFKSLKKKSEIKKLASTYVEAKHRRICPQIEWV